MLSHENNELITRVGRGTPMGDLMREYWVPAMLATELPQPDCDPVRVLLLGERLIGFRDSNGEVGLLPDACPHRGASLFFGQNREAGLRCVYHGWKFDVTGRCVDMPNEPADSDFKEKIEARGYPCVERAGIVWTYLGPRSEPPPMPAFEQFEADPEDLVVFASFRDCNWLQVMEGDLDTSHVGFLHTGHGEAEEVPEGTFIRFALEDRAPRYKVLDTPGGATYGAYRPAGSDDENYWRIGHYLFPFYTMTPTGVLGLRVGVRAWVPMDDHHTMQFSFGLKRTYLAPQGQRVGITGLLPPQHPNGTGWLDRFRPEQDAANDYKIDREAQRSGASYTGIDYISSQDIAVTESMGPIYDRSQERLGSSDVMLIRARRRLIAAAKAYTKDGTIPPGVDQPEAYRQRSGGVVLHKDADWIESTKDLRAAGVDHPELDPSIASGL